MKVKVVAAVLSVVIATFAIPMCVYGYKVCKIKNYSSLKKVEDNSLTLDSK